MHRIASISVIFMLVVLSWSAAAQSFVPYQNYEDNSLSEDYAPEITTDTTLFYRAIRERDDLFSAVTDYAFSSARFARRGVEYYQREVAYYGLLLPVRYSSSLVALRAERRRLLSTGGMIWRGVSVAGVDEYRFPILYAGNRSMVGMNFSDNAYTASIRGYHSQNLSAGWSIDASLRARTGRDLHADGVFTNAATVGLRVAKHWSDSEALSLVIAFAPSERGVRTSSSEEAFSLRGDNLYNPAWGWCDGKRRNSRVKRDMVPAVMATYQRDLTSSTSLTTALFAEAGTRRSSTLGWYDARTPMPDNYRYMPSYIVDESSAEVVAEAWRKGDSRYTQINWEELYAVNSMTGGEARYAVEDKVNRITDISSAVTLRTDIRDNLWIEYGVFAEFSSQRNYRQMRDLLGADFLTDIDLYLIDDDTYSNLLQNDMRHPDRQIREGDKFGYDYAMRRAEVGAMVGLEYRTGLFDLGFVANISQQWLHRKGFYEKELFPDSGSYGKSKQLNFSTYHLALSCGYAFTPRHYLGMSMLWAADAPEDDALFWNPQYNNRHVEEPAAEKSLAWEMTYRANLDFVQLQGSLFANSVRDEMETIRYYDDLCGEYINSSITNIDRLCYGVELAADFRISRRWRAEIAASAMQHCYSDNPLVRSVTDSSNSLVDSGSESHMKGCTPNATPKFAATAAVNYFSSRGWGVEMTAAWVGGRTVHSSLVRRTERVARQAASSPESFDAIVLPQRIGDGYEVGLMVSKMWRFQNESRIRLSLTIRNLLNNRNIVASAYESDRVRAVWQGANVNYEPLPNRMMYAYGRTLYLSAVYTF